MSRIARRLLKTTALLLGGVALLYLVGMNVFLRTRLFRDAIGADPDMLLVDYTEAHSLWPGRIHAEGVSIRGRDSHVEWILRIEHCDFRVSFTELAHKKFHADHVRGDGVSMRVRLRANTVTPEKMAALPPVPGFDYPPLKDVGPPLPPLTDATYNLWTIQLDDVVASHVHEVWIDTTRASGDLEIRGRWFFRPIRRLDVGPATVDVATLEVGYGMAEPWASGVVGRLGVTVHPLDIQTAEMIDYVSVDGDLDGTARVANAVNRLAEGTGLKVTLADAPFQLHSHVDHGVLRPGTHLHLAPFDARAAYAGLAFEASMQADLRVNDDNVGLADLHVAAARIATGGQARAWAAAVATTLSSRQLDLAHPFSDATYALDVDGARSDSLAYWRSRLAPTAGLEIEGTVAARGHLEGEVARQTAQGHVSFEARSLLASHGDLAVEGNLDGDVDIAHLDLEQHRIVGAVRVTARGATLRTKGTLLRADARARAVVREGRWDPVDLDLAGSDASLRNASASIRGARVVVPSLEARSPDLVVGKGGIAGRVALEAPRVEVASLAAVAALLPLPEDVAVESGAATASVRGEVDLAQLACRGDARIATRGLHLRIGAERMEGELTLGLRASPRGPVTDFSGSEVAYKSAGAPETPGWWGRMQLSDATGRLRPDAHFRAHLTAEARDASPLTALVASNTAIPQWLMNAVSTKELEVTGDVLLTPSVFAVRSVQAHAEGADVGFELSKIHANKDWAMLLDVGAVVAGIDVANGKTQVLLFGARPWFQRKAAWLQAAEQRSE